MDSLATFDQFNTSDTLPLCSHCGSEVASSLIVHGEEHQFCCDGCRQVFYFLQDNQLEKFYDFQHSSDRQKVTSWNKSREDFAYLDSEQSIKRYAKQGEGWAMSFYVEGIHCSACLFLIEKLPQIVERVHSSRLNFSTRVVTVTVEEGGSFADVAWALLCMGYRPRVLEDDEEGEGIRRQENRRQLLRLGVAGFCVGNIMLFSVSIYIGADGGFRDLFNLLSFFLFLPVVTYAAWPFYHSVIQACKQRRATVDLPIVLALMGGSILSVWRLAKGMDDAYFDSLSALVFLLLGSRYVLMQMQTACFENSHFQELLAVGVVRRLDKQTNTFQEVALSQIEMGDVLDVKKGECIPVDGELLSENALVDTSTLTGESVSQRFVRCDVLYAGTRLESENCQLRAQSKNKETRLGKILQEMESLQGVGGEWMDFSDKVARVFSWFILFVAVTYSLLFYSSLGIEAIHRALAFVIVACPCALAFGTPLTLARSLKRAANIGILVKAGQVFEKCAGLKKIIFDKTGTLTEGQMSVVQWLPEKPSFSILKAVLAVEQKSSHPIAKAICRELLKEVKGVAVHVEDFEEIAGKGVRGFVNDQCIELLRSQGEHDSSEATLVSAVDILVDGECVSTVLLGDQLREDSKQTLMELNQQGYDISVLSGDLQTTVDQMSELCVLPSEKCHGEMSPEAKADFVKEDSEVLMVGDGVNDAYALQLSDVGVATQGSLDVSLKASDVYFTKKGIRPLLQLMVLGKDTFKVLKRNMKISFLYNLLFGMAALMGWVNPLVAAVLMPLSAMAIFISSMYGTSKLRKLSRGVAS